jgi:hypothetical protein
MHYYERSFRLPILNEYAVRGSAAAPIFSTFQVENIVLKRDRTKERTYERRRETEGQFPLSGSLLALTHSAAVRKKKYLRMYCKELQVL